MAAGVLPEGFVDSWALNLYHDGSEGIQPHLVSLSGPVSAVCGETLCHITGSEGQPLLVRLHVWICPSRCCQPRCCSLSCTYQGPRCRDWTELYAACQPAVPSTQPCSEAQLLSQLTGAACLIPDPTDVPECPACRMMAPGSSAPSPRCASSRRPACPLAPSCMGKLEGSELIEGTSRASCESSEAREV